MVENEFFVIQCLEGDQTFAAKYWDGPPPFPILAIHSTWSYLLFLTNAKRLGPG